MHHENFDVFGARKMHIVLNREADTRGRGHVARCTIERLMRDLGLRGIRRAKEPNTTRSAPRQQCPQDLVNRHFRAFAQNQLWVADITYVHTFTGWIYVAFVTDVFNREIVGWQVSRSLHTDLALDALKMGIYLRGRDGQDLCGLIHHSDRGVQAVFNWSSQQCVVGLSVVDRRTPRRECATPRSRVAGCSWRWR